MAFLGRVFCASLRFPEAVGRKGYLSPTHRVKGCYKRCLAGEGLLIFTVELIFMSIHCCIFLLVIS